MHSLKRVIGWEWKAGHFATFYRLGRGGNNVVSSKGRKQLKLMKREMLPFQYNYHLHTCSSMFQVALH